jgi:hypothetical protein
MSVPDVSSSPSALPAIVACPPLEIWGLGQRSLAPAASSGWSSIRMRRANSMCVVTADRGTPKRRTDLPEHNSIRAWSGSREWIFSRQCQRQVPSVGDQNRWAGCGRVPGRTCFLLWEGRTRAEASLWQMPPAGWPRAARSGCRCSSNFTVGSEWIYYARPEGSARPSIHFLSFSTGNYSVVAANRNPPATVSGNRSCSLKSIRKGPI